MWTVFFLLSILILNLRLILSILSAVIRIIINRFLLDFDFRTFTEIWFPFFALYTAASTTTLTSITLTVAIGPLVPVLLRTIAIPRPAALTLTFLIALPATITIPFTIFILIPSLTFLDFAIPRSASSVAIL
uniref:Uncharacterized protein n=1 Tax=Anopheles darlingi TaxID=43151 RepID=A0A2M4DJH0_ANODA